MMTGSSVIELQQTLPINMKKIILLPVLFVMRLGMAQKETIRFVDQDGQEVNQKNAKLLIQRLKFSDTLWEIKSYQIFGPMLQCVRAKDENGTN
jgi:hypothetical protein